MKTKQTLSGYQVFHNTIIAHHNLKPVTICNCEHTNTETKEMICRAMNSHDKLVKALYKLINAAEQTTKDLVGFDGAPALDNAIDHARALLSNVETN